MISVATITYKRHALLEEAIQSFIVQNQDDCEMVILNDNKDVEYSIDCKNIRIINLKNRFDTIGEKLKYCFDLCKHEHIFRLDDDDLLCKDSLLNLKDSIKNNPGYDIYRSSFAFFLVNNVFSGNSNNVNNGNCYTKKYISTIPNWKKSCGEDYMITFQNNARIYTMKDPTMFYRWGMGVYHVSGIFSADRKDREYLDIADKFGDNIFGNVKINPHFKYDYYMMEGKK